MLLLHTICTCVAPIHPVSVHWKETDWLYFLWHSWNWPPSRLFFFGHHLKNVHYQGMFCSCFFRLNNSIDGKYLFICVQRNKFTPGKIRSSGCCSVKWNFFLLELGRVESRRKIVCVWVGDGGSVEKLTENCKQLI